MTHITKKQFKADCSFHEYGRGRSKRNAIYFDWKSDYENKAIGFKFMVKCHVLNAPKQELFNILYDWVINQEEPPYWVEYRFAETDQKRFKVAITG